MSLGWLKHLVPASTRPKLRRAWTRLRHHGRGFACPICRSRLRQFEPWGEAVDFRCPVCGSKPPHRLALRYFTQHPEVFVAEKVLLHVAPEPELRVWLTARAKQAGMRYCSGGITGVGDEFFDLRQLPFADASIHLIYCCHVLNAMQDDRQAMAEIFRVLHPTGVALLQVPAFYQGETTLETNSLEERLAVFHDEGIFRCYTDADYVERLQAAGFSVEHFLAADQPAATVHREQLKAEVLHVCRRRSTGS